MEYRREENMILLRLDAGEEILTQVLDFCRVHNIRGGIFFGIGACGRAVTSTYLPEEKTFTEHTAAGVLELVSLTGNICVEDGSIAEHTHALFSYLDEAGEQKILAGHLKSAVISYTAELTLLAADPIEKICDPATGIMIWDLKKDG